MSQSFHRNCTGRAPSVLLNLRKNTGAVPKAVRYATSSSSMIGRLLSGFHSHDSKHMISASASSRDSVEESYSIFKLE